MLERIELEQPGKKRRQLERKGVQKRQVKLIKLRNRIGPKKRDLQARNFSLMRPESLLMQTKKRAQKTAKKPEIKLKTRAQMQLTEITAIDAIELLKSLTPPTGRAETLHVRCADESERLAVKTAATEGVRRGVVAMIVAAPSLHELDVIVRLRPQALPGWRPGGT